jgi:O-antigen/teichoic acid export membrane protein
VVQGLIILVAPIAVRILYGPAFVRSMPIALILSLAEVFMGIALIEYRLLAATGRTHELIAIGAVALVVALPLYAWGAKSGAPSLAAMVVVVDFSLAMALVSARARLRSLRPHASRRGLPP